MMTMRMTAEEAYTLFHKRASYLDGLNGIDRTHQRKAMPFMTDAESIFQDHM